MYVWKNKDGEYFTYSTLTHSGMGKWGTTKDINAAYVAWYFPFNLKGTHVINKFPISVKVKVTISEVC